MSAVSEAAKSGRTLISVVTGTFNEAENIRELVQRVEQIFASLPEFDYEIIVIDNSSTDGTREILREIAASDPRVKVILNARNFGHIRSPYHALLQSRGSAAICMASDLQDPPELIPDFIAAWRRGAMAVVAIRDSSEETVLFHHLRKYYYRLVERLADVRTYPNFTGFGLYDKRIVNYCRELQDSCPYFRGIIAEMGLTTSEIHYHQPTRKRGITKNNFYTLYDLALLGITSHSKIPLRLATMAGFLMALVSLLVGMTYFVYKLMFWQQFPIGTAPIVIGLFFFASVQLFFIGILGEYIGAIHTQVHKRPLVVEQERINF